MFWLFSKDQRVSQAADRDQVFFRDGTSKVFHGAELAAALAVVKTAFPPKPGSHWIGDQPLQEE
jgi:hypothetical protein